MDTLVAWSSAVGGLALGLVLVPVPGVPGSAVALLGLVAFAGLTDYAIVDRTALALAAGIAAVGVLGQVLSAPVGARALGGSAGAATGAALGAAVGALVPLPGVLFIGGIVGAVGGAFLGAGTLGQRLRGAIGSASGCFVAAGWDLVGVLGVGAVLALADFLSRS